MFELCIPNGYALYVNIRILYIQQWRYWLDFKTRANKSFLYGHIRVHHTKILQTRYF